MGTLVVKGLSYALQVITAQIFYYELTKHSELPKV